MNVALLMLSMPPATTVSTSPDLITWAARVTALILPAHALEMVNWGFSWGMPAFTATTLAELMGRSPVR